MARTTRLQFANALHDWARVFMRRSMHGFVVHLRSNNLSMSQMGALMHIHHHGSSGLSGIGDDLAVTNAAASQLVDRLVEQGFVIREEDPSDRRSKRIELTATGSALVDQAVKAQQRWFGDLAETLSEDEVDLATTTLKMLTDRASSEKEQQ